MAGRIVAKVVDVQRERKIMFKDKKSGKMMTAFVRALFVKDLDGVKTRISIWRQPQKSVIEFTKLKVYSFKKLMTDKYPDNKPHYLKTGYYSIIKRCSEETEEKFANIQDFDGKFEGNLQTSYF